MTHAGPPEHNPTNPPSDAETQGLATIQELFVHFAKLYLTARHRWFAILGWELRRCFSAFERAGRIFARVS